MKKFNLFLYTIFFLFGFSSTCNSQIIRLFTGTFTEAGEKGLYLFDLNREEGTFKLVSELDAGPNPSYFCISKKNGLIYAANEVMNFKGIKGGGVTTLKYNAKTGIAEKINELTVPNGGPCYISLSSCEDFLFMANYAGGSVAVVKLDDKGIPVSITDTILYEGEEGNVSNAHMISSDPAGKRVYVTDLGLDRIVIYYFDPVSGRLQQIPKGIVKLTKGAGPRHFVFSSDGTKMYVINELNSTISVFNVDTKGELNPVQTVTTLTEGFKGESFCADIHIGKNGDFLYGSNRGENTIVTFRIGSDGKLTLAGHTACGGDWPRNFVIDPSGKYILVGNQRSGNISLFRIDEKTGIPIEPGKDYKITSPACLKFSDIE
jgi:6-phosphogluconolactonase